jgi:FkbM family methyltransferase
MVEAEYPEGKVRTATGIFLKFRNWPEVFRQRAFPRKGMLGKLEFRSGLRLVFREGTRDWDVVHELMFAGAYRGLLSMIAQADKPEVFDLGANIGLFSLLAASANPKAIVHAYEPGPPNTELAELNYRSNPRLSKRINLHRKAILSTDGTADWVFDPKNPGGSQIVKPGNHSVKVATIAFKHLLKNRSKPCFVKMDIEGSEHKIIQASDKKLWSSVIAIGIEIHETRSNSALQSREKLRSMGFKKAPDGGSTELWTFANIPKC